MKGVTSKEKSGSIYWYAQVDGRKVYCGKGDKGKKLAEAARSKSVAKKYEQREVAAGLRVKKVHFHSVKELLAWYMALPSVEAQKSYTRKLQACTHLLKHLGNKPLGAIEADDLERYREKRTGANGTVNVEIAVLSAAYSKARKSKKIHADMVPGEFVMQFDNNPRPIVTDEQYEALLKAADDDYRDFIVCGYESAMRSNEISGLRAYQVHLDHVESEVPRQVVSYIDLGIFDTKTNARRTVPVSTELKKILKRRLEGLEPEDHVFTNNGKAWTGPEISHRFRRTCKRANVPHGDRLVNDKGERMGLVFHCLRHTRTTKWVEMGFSDEIIRRATGHKSLDAYRTYIKLSPSVVMRLVEDKTDNFGTKCFSMQS